MAGIPSDLQLSRKISAKDSPTTPSMPQRIIAWGACSREEPQPKFEFTTAMFAPV
jgi:hypothetical protein